MALTLTPEQREAWERNSPETVVGNPAASWDQELKADARDILADMSR